MISLPAGMMKLPQWKFVLATALGAGIWNTILAAAGLWLGQHFTELEHYTGPVAIALFAIIVIGYLYRVATWKKHH